MFMSAVLSDSMQTLPLVTVPTLKSPYDGLKIAAWSKPEEALERVMEQLGHEDWERNLDGLTGTRAVNEISRTFYNILSLVLIETL